MNILILANEYFNLFNFRENLIKQISNSEKFKKIILLAKYDTFQNKINFNYISKIDLDFKSRSLNPFSAIITLFKMNSILKNSNLDIIVSYTFKCNFFICLLNLFHNKILLVNITGMGEMFLSNNLIKRLIFFIYCFLLQKSNYIICQNKDDYNLILNKNKNLKNKLFIILGSGINLNKFQFSKIKKNKKIKFLMVARIIKEKGIIEFIDAASKFLSKYPHKAEFKIIGNTYNDKFKNIFFDKLKDINISYVKSSTDVHSEIIDSNCCVLPSYREGMSRFLLESLATGRPIITSNVPGCKELVCHKKNGFLLNSITSNEIFNAFEQFCLLSEVDIDNYSNFSRKISYQFDEKIINKQIISLLNN
mgnify:CR=1 FL=1